jgi:hypothetical protein
MNEDTLPKSVIVFCSSIILNPCILATGFYDWSLPKKSITTAYTR